MRQIKIFDTTLRDGEQAAGGAITLPEKLEIVRQLERLGVDVIEAGFPATSQGDFRAVAMACELVKDCQVAALSDVKLPNIETTAAALKQAVAPRLHTVLSTSDIHLNYQLRISREDAMEWAVAAVKRARQLMPDVEFSAMDATRSDPDFVCRMFEAAIAAGATVINVPDTLGYHQPPEFRRLVEYVVEHVRGIEKVLVSVHCHNDLGMATALSLCAIEAGAQQVECTVNGVGERAGNAALEEIVMALHTRRDYFQCETRIRTDEIWRTSRLVSSRMGFPVQPNKAVVGANAFSHSSGLHQDGMIKERTTYEIMTPQSIGRSDSRIIMSKHTGRNAFRGRLRQLGFELSDEEFARTFAAFKGLGDKKKEIADADIEALVTDELHAVPETYHLDHLQVVCGDPGMPTATVRLVTDDGRVFEDAAIGTGPVDALYQAINRIIKVPNKLAEFSVQSVTSGIDAQGEVSVRVESEEGTFAGRGASTDIIVASAKAYMNALNKLLAARRERDSRAVQTNGADESAAGNGRAAAAATADAEAVDNVPLRR